MLEKNVKDLKENSHTHRVVGERRARKKKQERDISWKSIEKLGIDMKLKIKGTMYSGECRICPTLFTTKSLSKLKRHLQSSKHQQYAEIAKLTKQNNEMHSKTHQRLDEVE